MCDTRGQFTSCLHFIGKGIHIAGCSFLLNPIIEKFRGRSDQFLEFLPTRFSHQRIRILTCGHCCYPNNQVILQQRVKRVFGCILSGGIGIKTEHYFANESLQDMRLLFGESCSLRCDHILNFRFKQGDQIELPFTDDRALGFD